VPVRVDRHAATAKRASAVVKVEVPDVVEQCLEGTRQQSAMKKKPEAMQLWLWQKLKESV